MIQAESRLTVCDNSGAKEALCKIGRASCRERV